MSEVLFQRQRFVRLLPTALVAALLSAVPASAQQTRQAIASEQRLAKARDVRRIEPGAAERWFLKISRDRLLERLVNPRRGWFLRVGLPGEAAGFGVGPAWRVSNPDRSYTFTASTAASAGKNWIGELALQVPDLLPSLAGDRVFAGFSVFRSARSSDDFWGLGLHSAAADRATYRLTQTSAAGRLGVRLMPWLNVSGAAEWLQPRIGRGPVGDFPSIQEVFAEATAPGLAGQPAFLVTDVSFDLDYRDSIPSTRTAARLDQMPLAAASRGGRYRISLASYHDRELHTYSFRRTTIDVQQHVPFLHGHRVWSMRALAVLSDAPDGQLVPFYLSPSLGGSAAGRGFPSFRFRDDNLLLLQSEYRYVVNPFVSGAVFVDAGQVAPRAGVLAWSRFRTSYGVGLRLGTRGAAALRLDLALGGEQPRLVLGLGHAF